MIRKSWLALLLINLVISDHCVSLFVKFVHVQRNREIQSRFFIAFTSNRNLNRREYARILKDSTVQWLQDRRDIVRYIHAIFRYLVCFWFAISLRK